MEKMSNELMTTDVMNQEAEQLCRWGAARAGVLSISPVLPTVAICANDVYMVTRIAGAYGKDVGAGAIMGFLAGLGGSLLGVALNKLLPMKALKVPVAMCMTYAIGQAAKRWISMGMPLPLEGTGCQEELSRVFTHIKTTVDMLAPNPLKHTPLGDETRDFIAETGTKVESLGSTVLYGAGEVFSKAGLESAVGALAGIVGMAGGALKDQLDSCDSIDGLTHAASGIGSLLLVLAESAADLTKSMAVGSVEAAKSVMMSDDLASTVTSDACDALFKVSEKVQTIKDNLCK